MKHGLLIAILPSSLIVFVLLSTNTKVSKSGEQYVYTWQSTTVGYNDIEHLYQTDTNTLEPFFNRASQRVRVTIKSGILKTVISRDTSELVSFQIVDPEIELEIAGQTVNCELLKKELTHPVFVEISRQGLMKLVRIDTAIADFSSDMIKGILSRLQFVQPAEKSNAWETIEQNTSGVYSGKYRQVQSSKGGREFEKKNEGYTKYKLPGKNQRITDDGKTTFSTDTAGAVIGINSKERQVVLFGDDTVALSTSAISVMLQSTSRVSYKVLKPFNDLIRSPNYNYHSTLGEAMPEYKINRLVYSKTLGDENLASLMEALSLQDGKEEENLILKFRALAYLFPNHCQDLGRILKKELLGSYTFRVLSSALANAETEMALNALASVIDARRIEEALVIELLPMLATSKTPTEQAISLATQLAFSPTSTRDVAYTAQLAFSGMIGTLKKTNEKRAGQLTAFVLDRMKYATDTLQKILVLANTGSETILPSLKTYLEHPGTSREVRIAAISGFRLMNNSTSVKYLNKMIYNKDTLVSKKAKEVLAFKKEQS